MSMPLSSSSSQLPSSQYDTNAAIQVTHDLISLCNKLSNKGNISPDEIQQAQAKVHQLVSEYTLFGQKFVEIEPDLKTLKSKMIEKVFDKVVTESVDHIKDICNKLLAPPAIQTLPGVLVEFTAMDMNFKDLISLGRVNNNYNTLLNNLNFVKRYLNAYLENRVPYSPIDLKGLLPLLIKIPPEERAQLIERFALTMSWPDLGEMKFHSSVPLYKELKTLQELMFKPDFIKKYLESFYDYASSQFNEDDRMQFYPEIKSHKLEVILQKLPKESLPVKMSFPLKVYAGSFDFGWDHAINTTVRLCSLTAINSSIDGPENIDKLKGPHLLELRCSNSYYSDQRIIPLIKESPNLKTLAFRPSNAQIDSLIELKQLKELFLNCQDKLGPEQITVLHNLLPQLDKFGLLENRSDRDKYWLTLFDSKTNLTELLINDWLSETTLEQVLKQCPKLQVLRLQHGYEFSEDFYRNLIALCPHIKILKPPIPLHADNPFDNVLEFLVKNYKELEELEISCSQITDISLSNLILYGGKLKRLNISFCKNLSVAAIEMLIKKLQHLQFLVVGVASTEDEDKKAQITEQFEQLKKQYKERLKIIVDTTYM